MVATIKFARNSNGILIMTMKIPRNLKDALMLDKRNGDDSWSKAADKEIEEFKRAVSSEKQLRCWVKPR